MEQSDIQSSVADPSVDAIAVRKSSLSALGLLGCMCQLGGVQGCFASLQRGDFVTHLQAQAAWLR